MRDNLPVIAQATDSIFDDRDKSFEAGCDDYINDPFNQKQLLEVIEKHLSNKYILN
jgi:CheY-like chemotaxis protein